MKVTLVEAAALMGKSPRQLRYLIKEGRLTGAKHEGRWMFDSEALPVSAARTEARQRKAAELTAAVEAALAPHVRPDGRRAYSVVDLSAFRSGTDACREATRAFGATHAVTGAITSSLTALAQGCHRFHHREKTQSFQQARESAAAAVAFLHIDGGAAALTLADFLEQRYLSSLVGLLRRQEKQERKERR